MKTPTLPFRWITHDKREIPVTQMRTMHLFYSLRMVYNALAPHEFRVEGNTWDISNRPIHYWKRAVSALMHELMHRDDLTDFAKGQMLLMAQNLDKIATLQIKDKVS